MMATRFQAFITMASQVTAETWASDKAAGVCLPTLTRVTLLM
ncbi:MAG: hypothetical protein ACJ72I_19090 [Pseudonocardiaceae bacterium]